MLTPIYFLISHVSGDLFLQVMNSVVFVYHLWIHFLRNNMRCSTVYCVNTFKSFRLSRVQTVVLIRNNQASLQNVCSINTDNVLITQSSGISYPLHFLCEFLVQITTAADLKQHLNCFMSIFGETSWLSGELEKLLLLSLNPFAYF